jgi:hypothetical protein
MLHTAACSILQLHTAIINYQLSTYQLVALTAKRVRMTASIAVLQCGGECFLESWMCYKSYKSKETKC